MADANDELERRVAALEAAVADRSQEVATPVDSDSELWLLESLEQRVGEAGGVAVVGSVPHGDGRARWQYGLSSRALDELPWEGRATAFAALGSPVRLRLLQLVHRGVHGSADLAARDDLGTSGQVQHHLRALVNAGWLEQTARGQYDIPLVRRVPLLAALVAAGT